MHQAAAVSMAAPRPSPRVDPAVLAALRRRYPRVRWGDVRLHEGIPPLLRWRGARAMVLPCAWHPRRVHVHLSAVDLPTLLHEAAHVQQYQDLGPGVGYLRPFTVAYLAWAPFRGTGRAHPLEAPAYAGRRDERARFWRVLAGEGRARWLAPLRLALGVAGGLLALLLGPLVEVTSSRGRAPPPP